MLLHCGFVPELKWLKRCSVFSWGFLFLCDRGRSKKSTSVLFCFSWKLSLNKRKFKLQDIKSLPLYWLEHLENENFFCQSSEYREFYVQRELQCPTAYSLVFSVYELILSGSVSFGIVSSLTGFQTWWSPWVLSLFHLWVFLLLEEKSSCDWEDWNYTQCNSLTHKFIRELLLLVSGWEEPNRKPLQEGIYFSDISNHKLNDISLLSSLVFKKKSVREVIPV